MLNKDFQNGVILGAAAGAAAGIDVPPIVVDDFLSLESENPVQNKVITEKINEVTDDVGHKLDKTGGTMSGDINMNGNLIYSVHQISYSNDRHGNVAEISPNTLADKLVIKGVQTPSTAGDSWATSKKYVDDAVGSIPVITVDSALSDTSENPVQNKVVKNALDDKLPLSGGTMTGDIDLNSKNINNVNEIVFDKDSIGNSPEIYCTDPSDRIAIKHVATPQGDSWAANKKYVDDADALSEKLANKATVIDDTADNTKYPTTLAVKNAVEAIPASPATRTRVIIAPEDIEDFSATYGAGGTAEKPYFAEIWGKIPIGKIVDGAFVSTTNPAFLAVYEEESERWVLDKDAVISNASFITTYQGTTLSFPMDTIESYDNQLLIENDTVIWYFETRKYFETQAEAQQTAEVMQQLISTGAVQNMRFIYETFIEQNLEFGE